MFTRDMQHITTTYGHRFFIDLTGKLYKISVATVYDKPTNNWRRRYNWGLDMASVYKMA